MSDDAATAGREYHDVRAAGDQIEDSLGIIGIAITETKRAPVRN